VGLKSERGCKNFQNVDPELCWVRQKREDIHDGEDQGVYNQSHGRHRSTVTEGNQGTRVRTAHRGDVYTLPVTTKSGERKR